MRPITARVITVSLLAALPALAQLPADYAGKPFSDPCHQTGPARIPGIVQCALYDLGGEGVAYHDTTPENEGSGGLNRQVEPDNHQREHAAAYIWHFREREGVDLSYVKDWADLNHPNAVSPPINQHYIGWASDGEWVNYTVEVAEPGRYAVSALYTYAEQEVNRGPDGAPLFPIRFDLDGRPAATCELPRPTHDWHRWDYGRIATIEFPTAGPHLITFHYRRGNNWAFLVFERLPNP